MTFFSKIYVFFLPYGPSDLLILALIYLHALIFLRTTSSNPVKCLCPWIVIKDQYFLEKVVKSVWCVKHSWGVFGFRFLLANILKFINLVNLFFISPKFKTYEFTHLFQGSCSFKIIELRWLMKQNSLICYKNMAKIVKVTYFWIHLINFASNDS